MRNVCKVLSLISISTLVSCGYLDTKISDPGEVLQPAVKGCSVSSNVDGTHTISCPDGTTATINNGKDGAQGPEGKSGSCTVSQAAHGATISCSDGTTATVTNGLNGKDGADGAPGRDGRDGKDGLPDTNGAASANSLEIVTIGKNYEKGTSSSFNKPIDRDGAIALPEYIKVVYGNAGDYTARICVNGACCTYKGGASVHTPLSSGHNDNGNRAMKLSEMQEIEKGRVYKFFGCDGGLNRKEILVKKYDHIWAGVDHGDSTMETVAEFILVYK